MNATLGDGRGKAAGYDSCVEEELFKFSMLKPAGCQAQNCLLRKQPIGVESMRTVACST
jgi:hypothetical protein